MLLSARAITRVFPLGGAPVRALRGVDVQLDAGQSLAVAGPSGSGKSTLLQVLGVLDRDYTGDLLIRGQSVRGQSDAELARLRLTLFGFLLQSFHLLPEFDVRHNIALPHWRLHGNRAAALRRADDLLQQFDLHYHGRRATALLSGGEMQRVALARALVNDPPILLADEPTGNLDSHSASAVLQALRDQVAANRALIVASHDPAVIALAQRTLWLRDGQQVPPAVATAGWDAAS